METHHIIRERLRAELDRHGLTAVELARSAGVKTSFIYDILNGKSTNPSTIKLAQVAESLGIDLAYLAGAGEGKPRADSTEMAAIACITLAQHKGGLSVITTEDAPYYFHRSWLSGVLGAKAEGLRMLRIEGDSMAPTLHNKDMVLVDTTRQSPSPAGIFAIFDGFGLTAKRLEPAGSGPDAKIRVISDNTQYGAYERALGEMEILGRVVWFSRQI